MKKLTKAICMAAAVTGTAVFVCRKTKRIQEEARRKGRHVPHGPYEAVLKRPLDVLFVGMGLIPLAPVLAVTALLVRVKLGSPVLFKQERPGKDERIFTLYKFRTMTDERDADGELLPDEKRLTRFGRWLRSTSLDELPELFNILKGDMSFVGPRPLLIQYLPRYSGEQKHRHDVRPGLTGYAQAHGRNAISWEEKLGMDVWYTRNVTFKTDADIFQHTVKAVWNQEGISGKGSATMTEFMGNG